LEARVIPDGAVDIIFDLAAPGASTGAFVVGAMTAPLVVKPARECDYVAVRFHPGAAQPLFGNSMRELSDHHVELGSIWPQQVASEWMELLREAGPTEARVRALRRLLTRKVLSIRPPEPRVREAIRRLDESDGSVSVEELSRGLGLTRQHMTRLFEHHVGVGVKFFSRIIRLRLVLRELKSMSGGAYDGNWATLALDSGFFDQAHFVRDFRTLTGTTPSRFHVETGRGLEPL
jgi:AraC-like DNA-binding protein